MKRSGSALTCKKNLNSITAFQEIIVLMRQENKREEDKNTVSGLRVASGGSWVLGRTRLLWKGQYPWLASVKSAFWNNSSYEQDLHLSLEVRPTRVSGIGKMHHAVKAQSHSTLSGSDLHHVPRDHLALTTVWKLMNVQVMVAVISIAHNGRDIRGATEAQRALPWHKSLKSIQTT